MNPHSILEDKLRITLAHAVAEPAVLSILDNNWKMPLLNKMTAREALQFLEGFKGDVEIVGEGVVRFQIPGPGVSVDQRGKIRLTLGEP